jgi:hypothetical protein
LSNLFLSKKDKESRARKIKGTSFKLFGIKIKKEII